MYQHAKIEQSLQQASWTCHTNAPSTAVTTLFHRRLVQHRQLLGKDFEPRSCLHCFFWLRLLLWHILKSLDTDTIIIYHRKKSKKASDQRWTMMWFDFSHVLTISLYDSVGISGRDASIARETGITGAFSIRLADASAWIQEWTGHPMAGGNFPWNPGEKMMINRINHWILRGVTWCDACMPCFSRSIKTKLQSPTGSPYHCRNSRNFHRNTRGHTGNVHASVSTGLLICRKPRVWGPSVAILIRTIWFSFFFKKLIPQNYIFWL